MGCEETQRKSCVERNEYGMQPKDVIGKEISMKTKMKRICSLVLALAMCLTLLPASACAIGTAAASIFCFVVQDEDGVTVGQADVALYSFLDEKVVATGRTNISGQVVLQYTPSLPDKDATYYGDYLALVTKEGYSPRLHFLTKLYTGSDTVSADTAAALNSEAQLITLSPAPSGETVNSLSAEEQSIADYCRENKKLTTSSPIYVLQEEDFSALRAANKLPQTRATYEYYYNQNVPLGEFHTNNNCTTSVKLSSSDTIRVEAAQKIGSAFAISGSVSRSLGQIIQFPDFTASITNGLKRTYLTQGTFAKKTVSYLSQGETYTTETVSLHEITGGVYWDTPVRCSSCGKSASSVLAGQYGTYIHLYPGSFQANYKQTTVNFGLKSTITIDTQSLSLGATLSTTSTTEVKYSASGEIYLYDMDHSGDIYHVSNA